MLTCATHAGIVSCLQLVACHMLRAVLTHASPAGIVYGLYLTISSWVLFVVVTKSEFFHDHLNMFSLNTQQGVPGHPAADLCLRSEPEAHWEPAVACRHSEALC